MFDVNVTGETPEVVALYLFEEINGVRRRTEDAEASDYTEEWILSTYEKCLKTVLGATEGESVSEARQKRAKGVF